MYFPFEIPNNTLRVQADQKAYNAYLENLKLERLKKQRSLMQSCETNHTRSLLKKLQPGCCSEAIDLNFVCDSETPLSIAAKNGHTAIVIILLDWGAEVDFPNQRGNSPLVEATLHNHMEVVELLLVRKANVALPFQNSTVFHYATHNDKILERLLLACDVTNKANLINVLDNNGKTSLQIAIENLSLVTVKLLLKHGTNLKPITNKPLDLACNSDNSNELTPKRKQIIITLANAIQNEMDFLVCLFKKSSFLKNIKGEFFFAGILKYSLYEYGSSPLARKVLDKIYIRAIQEPLEITKVKEGNLIKKSTVKQLFDQRFFDNSITKAEDEYNEEAMEQHTSAISLTPMYQANLSIGNLAQVSEGPLAAPIDPSDSPETVTFHMDD